MSDVTVIRSGNSLFVPVAGLTLFAVASGFLMSLLPLSLTYFGLEKSLAAYLASAFYAGMLGGALISARIVSRLGHRHAFVVFLLALLTSVIGLLAIPNEIAWLALRVVAGLASAGIYVVVESWLLLVDDDRQRAKRLGLYMTALYGGSALGQLGIGQLGTTGFLPYGAILALLALAVLPPLLVKRGAPVLEVHQPVPLKALRHLSRPAVTGCLVSGLVLGPLYGLMPLYIHNQPWLMEHTGALMAMVILGGMVVQPITGYLSPRMSKSLLMALLCGVGTLAVAGMLSADDLLMISACYLVLGACAFALYPVAITQACQGEDRARIVSITELMLLCYGVGSVAGPLVAGQMTPLRDGLPLYLGTCLAATCIYMLIMAARATKPVSIKMDPPSGE